MTSLAFSALLGNIRTDLPFRAVRAACGLLACAGFLLCPVGKAAAAPAGGVRPVVIFTQRGINALAAALDNARRIIVDDTGLRRPGETLPAYLARTSNRLPGEENAVYEARITRYLNALQEATTATAAARRLPALRDQSPANQLLWRHIVQALSYLPKRMQETDTTWRERQRPQERGDSKAFSAQLTQTVVLVADAFQDLRDACP